MCYGHIGTCARGCKTVKSTPWGHACQIEHAAEGIHFYSTPSHGGYKLDAAQQKKVPEYMRREGAWYEEDCDWAIVATVFPEAFPQEARGHAADTLQNWLPDFYERFYGVPLDDEQSYIRRARKADPAHP